MNIFTLEIFLEYEKCNIYTVVKDGLELSETEVFFRRYATTHREEILQLVSLLDYIGDKRGANQELFRFENRAFALPKNERGQNRYLEIDFDGFSLRLFCLRLSDEVLILFNGGVKDAATAQQSSLYNQFKEANRYAKAIDDALRDDYIQIEEKTIIGIDTEEFDY